MSRLASKPAAVLTVAAASMLLALVLAGPAPAQDAAAPAPQADPAVPVLPEPEPAHLAAAVDFLIASGATKGFEDMIPQFLDQIRLRFVGQRPEIADMINDASLTVVTEFVKRRDDLNKDLGKIYTSRFSEQELKDMAAFYRTPAGQKLATQQSDVLQESVPVVQSWSRKLSNDMAARIKEEVAKNGQKL